LNRIENEKKGAHRHKGNIISLKNNRRHSIVDKKQDGLIIYITSSRKNFAFILHENQKKGGYAENKRDILSLNNHGRYIDRYTDSKVIS
jgi:hypothetical protein